ncbi:MAG: hypothetical protein ACOYI8_09635 [Christensenellales bacterium]|jgi:hypothetical protein
MINQRIRELLEKNRSLFEGNPISFDGVVDEDSFLASPIRTAFLLKEINGKETIEENGVKVQQIMKADWEYMTDLRSHILAKDNKDKNLYPTWPNVCLWVELLKNPDCVYSDCISENENFNEAKLRENILSVSIINLKKTHGSGSSVDSEIREAVCYGRTMLKEQIDIINPTLVICGGTFEYAKLLFEVERNQDVMLPCGAHYFSRGKRIYLEFVHPSWFSVNRRILFAYAKQVFSDIMQVLGEMG